MNIEILYGLFSVIIYIMIAKIVLRFMTLAHYSLLLKCNSHTSSTEILTEFRKCQEHAESTKYIDLTFAYFWPIILILYVFSNIAQTAVDGLLIREDIK